MMRPYRTLARTIAVLAVFALFGGCGRVGPPSHRVGNVTLSDAEFRYGIAPQPNSSVVYQNDVVIVGRGAEAVRFVSSNGLTWTIDARAPHAQELIPGKIMFLTNRAVGRVLGIRQNGDNLAVTLGPVALTDVIKKAHMSFQQPVDLNAMIVYTAPDFPGAVVQAPKTSLRTSPIRVALQPLMAFAADAPSTLPAPTVGQIPQVNLPRSAFGITPFCCEGGIGIHVAHPGVVKLIITFTLRLEHPSVAFDLDISDGIQLAKVTLNGGVGLRFEFEAGSTVGVEANANLNDLIAVPMDLWIPIQGLVAPVAVNLHQSFLIKTGFSAKNSTLHAVADYSISGPIWMGYEHGSWGVGAPTDLKVNDSLMGSLGGASLGANGLVSAWGARIIVGIGAFGFATGPYMGYNLSVGVGKSSGAAALLGGECRFADLHMDVNAGVGYSIPKPITDAINFFLRELNLSARISSFGGLSTDHIGLLTKRSAMPSGCAGPAYQ